jgi:hypothetical protein
VDRDTGFVEFELRPSNRGTKYSETTLMEYVTVIYAECSNTAQYGTIRAWHLGETNNGTPGSDRPCRTSRVHHNEEHEDRDKLDSAIFIYCYRYTALCPFKAGFHVTNTYSRLSCVENT